MHKAGRQLLTMVAMILPHYLSPSPNLKQQAVLCFLGSSFSTDQPSNIQEMTRPWLPIKISQERVITNIYGLEHSLDQHCPTVIEYDPHA